MKILLLSLISFLFNQSVLGQAGCTDPAANNYDPAATNNNGSCTYNTTSYTLSNPKQLPASLNENSGLIYTDGQLWTLNDGGGANAIYKISEGDGSILQTVTVANATNIDWEALTADADYFYIGDFGNNTNGSRTDLKIYRVNKAAIGAGTQITVNADLISFSYQDQPNLTPTTANNTKFDCEAFLVKNNLIHLFTKDWVTHKTVHYTLPATPGTHLAKPKEELEANGLITDAHIRNANTHEIVLIGYSADLTQLFMWLLYDYTQDNFFNGNKRRIELGSALQGQIEGVTFTSSGNGYISSEQINTTVSGFRVLVPPKLFSFSTTGYVPLPVSLTEFTAVYKHPGVALAWQTATEKDNAFFIIERSVDAIHFKEISRQKGAGTSTALTNYFYTDQAPRVGINYYRLKQTDTNGSFSYSPVKSVMVAAPKINLNLYQNPTPKGQLLRFHYYQEDTSPTQITLTGADGKLWFTKQASDKNYISESLSTTKLQTGLYLLSVMGKQHLHTAKVLIE